MKSFKFIFALGIFIVYCSHFNAAFPQPANNPNAEYELINGGPQVGPKPSFVPATRKPLIINTPPPTPANSKNFAFDPLTKTWTQVKKDDPIPSEGTLLWNQSNDKWLTETARRI
ncbi:uncharacterized protein LOC129241679 [Anastrepha obliqua]|uniref:uncharacterized protein LOC128862484 n=1 Tax=Anastrepha ludens TaxID=28586 RepID=UPI0023B003BD|nr:uncharacterized protein LOC128862484 [Anastrepha ludens]XP_054734116.1 uncharacterized protein LOC129241679 [Anastrepha obliqua]